jgi:hypothetical protein
VASQRFPDRQKREDAIALDHHGVVTEQLGAGIHRGDPGRRKEERLSLGHNRKLKHADGKI